jgi:hypothetical protein
MVAFEPSRNVYDPQDDEDKATADRYLAGNKNAPFRAITPPGNRKSASDKSPKTKVEKQDDSLRGRAKRIMEGAKKDVDNLQRGLKIGGAIPDAVGESAKENSKSNKALLIGGGLGGLGVIVIFMAMLFLLLGLLKIPNLAANIRDYEFVAFTREFGNAADRVAEQELAVQATDDKTYTELKNQYANGVEEATSTTMWDKLVGKVDSLRPGKIIQTLGTEKGLTIKTKASGILGREVLQSVVIEGVDYPVKQLSGAARWLPGLRSIALANNNAQLYADIKPALESAIGADSRNAVGRAVQGLTLAKLRGQMGIGLDGFILSKFKNANDPNAARLEEERQKAKAINEPATAQDNALTEEIATADGEAAAAQQEVLASDKLLQQAVDNGGVSPLITNAIGNTVKDSWTKNVLGFIDPLYGIALPLCIIYDGSVQRFGPSIDNNAKQQMAAFYTVSTWADQQKKGNVSIQTATTNTTDDPTDLTRAIGAANTDLGDTSQSIPSQRANGQTVDTQSTGSAEAGAGGSHYYDIFNALGVSPDNAIGKVASFTTDHFCGILTNTATAVTLGVANVALAFATLGSSQATEEAAGQAASFSIKTLATRIVTEIFATQVRKQGVKLIEETALRRFARFMFHQALIFGGTAGATEIANILVAMRAGVVNSGLAQGADLANEADAGGNIVAGEAQRSQLFGRPLTNTEVTARDTTNSQQVAYENSQKSITDRYLALSNPRSLSAKLIIHVGNMIRPSIVGEVFNNLGSMLFKPFDTFGSLLNVFGVVHAIPDPSTQHYGNVQFGWSEDEQKLIDSSSSYLPLENQLVLDQSGQENAIAQQYASCFGYNYNPNGTMFDPTTIDSKMVLDAYGNGSIGNLLSSNNLPRDSQGGVVSDGDTTHCTPQNLGIANPIYGNLVFRWRLAMSYFTTVQQLTDLQTVTKQ